MRYYSFISILMMSLAVTPFAQAVDPEIRLKDPTQEARARAITQKLRCPTCVSQSVDSSNVGISRDLQLLVRERIIAGDSDQEILDYVAERYGDFVLLKPRLNGRNAILWGLPFLVFMSIAIILIHKTRKQLDTGKKLPTAAPLTPEEQNSLDAILNEHHDAST